MKARKREEKGNDGPLGERKEKSGIEAESIEHLSTAGKRTKAYDIFISSQGRTPLQDIAAMVGVSRQTISAWAKKEGWKEQLETIQQKVNTKLADAVAAKAVNAAEKHLQFIDAMDNLLLLDLYERDPDTGMVKLDAAGRGILRRDLTPSQKRELMSTKSDAIRTRFLLTGQPTDTSKITVDGEIKHDRSAEVKKAREEITEFLREGGEEAQAVLTTLLKRIKPDPK